MSRELPRSTVLLVLLLSSCAASRQPVTATAEGYVRQGVLALHRNDMQAADRSFRAALQAGGESQAGLFARDALTEMYGLRLYPDVVTDCPAAAQIALDQAEEQFASKHFDAAMPLYRTAVDNCPKSATIRMAMADAHYASGNYDQAKTDFLAALELDPWNRAAHRYLSDTEARLGNAYSAWEHAMLAVLSDPNYQMAWVSLGERTSGGPAALRRVRADKPYVNEDGALVVYTSDWPDADRQAWMSYGLALQYDETAGKSALQVERDRVDTALRSHGMPVAGSSGAARSFWDRMAEAKEAGYLDEAIFVHLIDKPMAAEYAAFRDRNRQRLVEYIEKMVSLPPATATNRLRV